jgi:hypothetical protein
MKLFCLSTLCVVLLLAPPPRQRTTDAKATVLDRSAQAKPDRKAAENSSVTTPEAPTPAETTTVRKGGETNAQVADPQAAKDQEEVEIQRKLARYTQWLVIVGAIQFIVLIAQAAVFWFTLRAMNRQTLLASDTAQRQLRAYICVSSALLKFLRPEVPEIQVHLKNSGQTPAYDVTGWIHMWIEEYPLKVLLPEPPEGFQRSREIIGPASIRTYIIAKKPPIPTESLPLLGTTRGTIYVYGEVRYKDAFGCERFTKYRLIYGGSEGVRKSKPDADGLATAFLKPDREGNESN